MKENAKTLEYLSRTPRESLFVSSVSIYELFTGVAKCSRPSIEKEKVEKLISCLQVVSFESDSAKLAAVIRANLESRGEMIGLYDEGCVGGMRDASGSDLIFGFQAKFGFEQCDDFLIFQKILQPAALQGEQDSTSCQCHSRWVAPIVATLDLEARLRAMHDNECCVACLWPAAVSNLLVARFPSAARSKVRDGFMVGGSHKRVVGSVNTLG